MAFTERSEATRTAILSAARKLLTERGYEGTTIRGVAALVGVDPSMVMRYYGNKAGLFSAAIDLDLRLDEVPLTPKSRLGESLARHFLRRGDQSDKAITLLLRSASTNPVAAEHVRTIFDTQIIKFVAAVTGATGPEVARRAGLITTQLVGLAMTRYVVELPPVVKMDTEATVAVVAPVLHHYLVGNLDASVRSRKSTRA